MTTGSATPSAPRAVRQGQRARRISGDGRRYVRFALDHPALFRLMASMPPHGDLFELTEMPEDDEAGKLLRAYAVKLAGKGASPETCERSRCGHGRWSMRLAVLMHRRATCHPRRSADRRGGRHARVRDGATSVTCVQIDDILHRPPVHERVHVAQEQGGGAGEHLGLAAARQVHRDHAIGRRPERMIGGSGSGCVGSRNAPAIFRP